MTDRPATVEQLEDVAAYLRDHIAGFTEFEKDRRHDAELAYLIGYVEQAQEFIKAREPGIEASNAPTLKGTHAMGADAVVEAGLGLGVTNWEHREVADGLRFKDLVAKIDDELNEQAFTGRRAAALTALAIEHLPGSCDCKSEAVLLALPAMYRAMDNRLCTLGGYIESLIWRVMAKEQAAPSNAAKRSPATAVPDDDAPLVRADDVVRLNSPPLAARTRAQAARPTVRLDDAKEYARDHWARVPTARSGRRRRRSEAVRGSGQPCATAFGQLPYSRLVTIGPPTHWAWHGMGRPRKPWGDSFPWAVASFASAPTDVATRRRGARGDSRNLNETRRRGTRDRWRRVCNQVRTVDWKASASGGVHEAATPSWVADVLARVSTLIE